MYAHPYVHLHPWIEESNILFSLTFSILLESNFIQRKLLRRKKRKKKPKVKNTILKISIILNNWTIITAWRCWHRRIGRFCLNHVNRWRGRVTFPEYFLYLITSIIISNFLSSIATTIMCCGNISNQKTIFLINYMHDWVLSNYIFQSFCIQSRVKRLISRSLIIWRNLSSLSLFPQQLSHELHLEQ